MRWTRPTWLPAWLRGTRPQQPLTGPEGDSGTERAEMLRRDDALVTRLLPDCRIPALRAVDPEPHWLGGHGLMYDPHPRLVSVDIVSGDPWAPDGPCVRVETADVADDVGAVVVGRCEMTVDGRPLPMEVVTDVDGGTAGGQAARGSWEGYAVRVQAAGVPLDGLPLTRAGDLTRYRQPPRRR